MKKTAFVFIASLCLAALLVACDELENFNPALTETEVAQGLKEALRVGTDTSVSVLNATDGYFADQAVKILLPQEVQVAKAYVPASLWNETEKLLNRAAEDAAGKAKPIFVSAITGISINDAWGILRGTDTAATSYLRLRTTDSLAVAFLPDVQNSMNTVGAEDAWRQIANTYNSAAVLIPGQNTVPTSLSSYVTGKAIDGLFVKVATEEKKIRENPLHRVTDLLKRVFSELDE